MNDVLLVVVVLVALGFDFTNGFHDTANAVATSVSTRALSPRLAVAIAAVANLAGAFVTTAVAKTVGEGIIDTGLANEKTVLAALIGAIAWNLITWWLGLPVELLARADRRARRRRDRPVGRGRRPVARTSCTASRSRGWWLRRSRFAGAFLLLIAIYWLLRPR